MHLKITIYYIYNIYSNTIKGEKVTLKSYCTTVLLSETSKGNHCGDLLYLIDNEFVIVIFIEFC